MKHVDEQLLAFHFAAMEAGERAQVEAHLNECASCVSAFLEVKRKVELGEEAARPSAVVRARLRSAVRAEFAPPRARWERPVAWAIAAALVLFAASLIGQLSKAESAPRGLPTQVR